MENAIELIGIQTIIRSVFLGFLYFWITKDNDTSIVNISRFSLFYLGFYITAKQVGIDQNVITTAFTTKFIFTLLEDHIQQYKKEKDYGKTDSNLNKK